MRFKNYEGNKSDNPREQLKPFLVAGLKKEAV